MDTSSYGFTAKDDCTCQHVTLNASADYYPSSIVSVHGPNHSNSLGGTLWNGMSRGPDRQKAILEPSENIVAVDGSPVIGLHLVYNGVVPETCTSML